MLKMQDDKYPRICKNRLKKLSEVDSASPKYNWVVQVNESFFKINLKNIRKRLYKLFKIYIPSLLSHADRN